MTQRRLPRADSHTLGSQMDTLMSTNQEVCLQARARKLLREAPFLTRVLQTGRAVLDSGPWRHVAREVIRRRRRPQNNRTSQTLTSLQLNAPQLAQALRADDVAMAGNLPPDMLSRVRAVTDNLPPGEYREFNVVPDIRALVQCAGVLSVVRGYLGSEPELLECNLVVGHAEGPTKPRSDSQRLFHFDYAGWHSLNLFIYLIEVGADSGAHQVVAGTHRSRKLWDAVRPSIPDDEITKRFGENIRTITGPAGTMFFEDTAAFHRRLILKRRRVMLNILYASHRSWLSKGRLTPKYAEYLRSRGIA